MCASSIQSLSALRIDRLAALAALHVLFFALAYPPLNLWPLAFVSLAPLILIALLAPSTRIAVGVTGVAWWLMSMAQWWWLIDISVVGYPFLAAYMALFPMLAVWLIRRVAHSSRTAFLPMAIVAPVVWVGIEFLRGDIAFNGFPWFLLGHPLIEWPLLAQGADVFGAYGASFLCAMVAGLIADIALAAASRKGIAWAGNRVIQGSGLVVVLFLANIFYGWFRLAQTEPMRDGPVIIAIQTNLPQSNKMAWTVEEQIRDFQRFIALTLDAADEVAADGDEPDLILWPETMLPGRGLEPDAIEFVTEHRFYPAMEFPQAMIALYRHLQTPLLVGSFAYIGLGLEESDGTSRWTWQRLHNSAYLIDGQPPLQRYDKVFLTPFGETMPYISNWPWLERQLLALGAAGMRFDLDAGDLLVPLTFEASRTMDNDHEHSENGSWQTDNEMKANTWSVSTPICFEVTMARICRAMIWSGAVKRADVLINLSNDGWFGSFDGGRAQHAQMARWRCIENRVPMVRSVNTGLSLAVDSRGVITHRLGDGRYGEGRIPGWITAHVQVDDRRTLFSRIGHLPAALMLILTGLLAVVARGEVRLESAG